MPLSSLKNRVCSVPFQAGCHARVGARDELVFTFDPVFAGVSHHALEKSGPVGFISGRFPID